DYYCCSYAGSNTYIF
nr:immunoglobulin light chain junction region [Macaca mulatta]MOW03784.1 immunoglobulin light chain junction region [Macaca mulatta]MOW14980.1 immunoglobulin light chain junction region [Macaca mulatta]MOW16579.1 immunoglobulin light chain junction region [Macaca mulatta]MOW18447.1 immunoglobulin light chain junction region [Macaca mulatta]